MNLCIYESMHLCIYACAKVDSSLPSRSGSCLCWAKTAATALSTVANDALDTDRRHALSIRADLRRASRASEDSPKTLQPATIHSMSVHSGPPHGSLASPPRGAPGRHNNGSTFASDPVRSNPLSSQRLTGLPFPDAGRPSRGAVGLEAALPSGLTPYLRARKAVPHRLCQGRCLRVC